MTNSEAHKNPGDYCKHCDRKLRISAITGGFIHNGSFEEKCLRGHAHSTMATPSA